MTESFNVGDLVAEFLQQCGVTTAYGVVSVHNIPMLDGIGRRNAIRFVPSRGEAGGGHMADAHARVSGGLGVLFSSTGPGAANTPGALVEARFAATPLLHLTGQSARQNLGTGQGAVHDVPDQLGMLAAVSKKAYRIESAQTAFATLCEAAAQALTPPMGPVSVEIPIDVQRTNIARPEALDNLVLPIPSPRAPSAGELDRAADALANAKRPLLWCGGGAREAGAAVARLVALGVPLVTSWQGRGVMAEDQPMTLGGLNGNGSPLVEAFYETVDLMIVAGSRLRGHETRDMTMTLPARRIQIDVDPLANGRTYDCEQFICADVALTLDALADRLEGRMSVQAGYEVEIGKLKADATTAYLGILEQYAGFPAALRQAMPRDALFVRDVTLNNSTWGNRIFPLYGPRDSVYPVGAGIGPGSALGIGAAIAAAGDGRKTVAMCGDGGFNLGLAELPTAVQEGADVTFLVMNDGGYGVIGHIQDAMYGERRYFGDVRGANLKIMAEATGMPYWKVGNVEEFGAVVAEAIAHAGPALVEVDMVAIGPYPRYFAPPPFAEASKD
ncbi:MAG: thiamine pyrophosphate-binding protein [Alphaproteobacteria bacterium]|nr:thiamine pyrophosphate-binding protein [Alphaproteobacteria bacterium]